LIEAFYNKEPIMPYLNIKLGASPSPKITSNIVNTLTDLTAEILKKKRELIAISVEYVDPAAWFIGGSALTEQAQSSFYLEIKVTEGTNTKDEKSMYVSRVFAALESILGSVAPASYIVIHDVHADSWGYQGQSQEYRYIRGKSN
jgi:4-oxalocrotonate tautomerase